MVSVVRGSVIAMVIALMIGAVVAYFTPAGSASGGNEPVDLQAEVREALKGFFAALLTGEPDRVAATLAPEFQIMRADGSNYDANRYPQGELPIISEMPAIEKLNVTAEGGIAVAAYYVNIDQTRDGKLVEAYAPRLSVFRKDGDRWLLVAHGNFAP
ncbi:MAG TPA: nuclear transport factor 2 family protein [Bauldia sp.]|nr:nuclear transport factor 2 family protein [Bauldia sp.]